MSYYRYFERPQKSFLSVFTFFFWTCSTIYNQFYHYSTSNRPSTNKLPYRAIPLILPSKFPTQLLHTSLPTRCQNVFFFAFSQILLNLSLIFNVATRYYLYTSRYKTIKIVSPPLLVILNSFQMYLTKLTELHSNFDA